MIKLFIIGSLFSFGDTSQIATQTDMQEVNKYHSQYFPQFNRAKKELYFTVRKNKGDHEDLYVSSIEHGKVLSARSLEKINTNYLNEGTCTFNEDGTTMIFSACDYPNSKGGCDLYESKFEKEEWTPAKNLGFFINSREWDGQPHLTNGGKTLYFSSERGGGLGNRDIWVSEKNDQGIWGIPKNLGPSINTKSNEIGPYFIKSKQIIVFSSDRKDGKGKLDFYQSLLEEGEWKAAKNLGILNSEEENAGFSEGLFPNEFYLTESNSQQSPMEKIYSILLPDSIWLKPIEKKIIEVPIVSKIQFSEISFKDILFANNKWDLPHPIPKSLTHLLQYLQENPESNILIEGHSDETGNAKSNIILSEKRAQSVKNYLLQNGIHPARINIQGFGHSKPKSKDLAGNRRIEVRKL